MKIIGNLIQIPPNSKQASKLNNLLKTIGSSFSDDYSIALNMQRPGAETCIGAFLQDFFGFRAREYTADIFTKDSSKITVAATHRNPNYGIKFLQEVAEKISNKDYQDLITLKMKNESVEKELSH